MEDKTQREIKRGGVCEESGEDIAVQTGYGSVLERRGELGDRE